MNTSTQSHQTEICQSIKLGIDAHARFYHRARQVDGATPKPVHKMTSEGLLHFVSRQQRLTREVFTCYEARAFGYELGRRLTKTRPCARSYSPSISSTRSGCGRISQFSRNTHAASVAVIVSMCA